LSCSDLPQAAPGLETRIPQDSVIIVTRYFVHDSENDR
jgi:hypothetical protein